MSGGLDKRPPILSNCFCYLTSPFFMVKIFAFHFRGFDRTARTIPENLITAGADLVTPDLSFSPKKYFQ